jgi:hypothetical protein
MMMKRRRRRMMMRAKKWRVKITVKMMKMMRKMESVMIKASKVWGKKKSSC